MNIKIGDLDVELSYAHEFRQIITYIESDYSKKCKDIGVNYTPDHVFDEDKSVKWNRQQVESQNAEKIAARDRLRLERMHNYDTLYEYLKLYIEESIEVSNLSVTFIDNLREYLRNSHGSDWPCSVDGLLDLLILFKGEISK